MGDCKFLKLSDEDKEKYEYQVINAMIDVYNKRNDEMNLDDEIKIILNTIKAGYDEAGKIKDELIKGKEDEYSFVSFYPDIDQLLLSCVAGGIIWGSDKIPHDNLHPYNTYGYRIRSLIMALKLLNSCDIFMDIADDELAISVGSYKRASKMLAMLDDNDE